MFVHHARAGVNTLWDVKARPKLRLVIRAAMRDRGIRHVNGPNGLAQKAGVAKNTIYNWENGSNTPALEELDLVAVALGLPLSVLVDAWSDRDTQTAASPVERARRLRDGLDELIALLDDPSEMEAAEAAAAETLPQPPGAGAAGPEHGDGAASAGHDRKLDR